MGFSDELPAPEAKTSKEKPDGVIITNFSKIKYLFSQIALMSWFHIYYCFKRQIKNTGNERAR